MQINVRQLWGSIAGLGRALSAGTTKSVALGDAARDQRKWREAAEHYGRALTESPRNQPIWVQYGHALKESAQLAAAEDAYRRAIALEPEDGDAHLQLGHCLKVKGDLFGAVGCYVNALQCEPENSFARKELQNYGWTSAELESAKTGRNRSSAAVPARRFKPVAASCPKNYATIFGDVNALVLSGIVASAEQHFELYGYKQGRDILATFADTKPTVAFVLCPSFFKRCGIGEHSRYLAKSIEMSGLKVYPIRTSAELKGFSEDYLRDAVLIVNHGPGLFDGYNAELSEGEATIDLLSNLRRYFVSHNLRPILFMHSLLDRDNTVMFPRQQMLLEFPIPVVTTIEAAARIFNIPRVEHGMQPIELPAPPVKEPRARDFPTIGFFGFFQWGGKNFDALFNVAQKLKAKLVGSVATGSSDQIEILKNLISEKEIRCDIGTGWVDDSELALRLNEADFFYLPQHDYDHWNNSGTARFVMNFGRPVIVPPHNPFLDLRSFAIFSHDDDLPQLIAHLRGSEFYEQASQRVARYGEAHSMPTEMARLACSPHEIAIDSGTENFFDVNRTCAEELLHLDLEIFRARVGHISKFDIKGLKSSAGTAERMTEIAHLQRLDPRRFATDRRVVLPLQYWREHYEVCDLLFEDQLDTFYAANRAILKREPDLHDLVRFHGEYEALCEQPADNHLARNLRMFGRMLAAGHNLEFANQVQLYHEGRELVAADLEDPALAKVLLARQTQTRRLLVTNGATDPIEPDCSFYNIVQMLPCRGDVLGELLQSAVLKSGIMETGITPDFTRVVDTLDPLQRLTAVSDCLATMGLRLTDVFVIDKPTVRPVDFSRKRYSLAEFWLLDGDYFLFEAVICLLKRNPLAAELYLLDEVFREQGRVGVLGHLLRHPACQAEIVDISSNDGSRLDADAKACDKIGRELRSVYAGGWDQRNAYLEAVRNNERLWLSIKHQRDRIYSQAGERLDVITNMLRAVRDQ
ncbi:tetratricopeptide repeat protein [Erythrobacter tepidarius]|uniref:tetratricopeptide repeat protein n=1 Tax=Erythrobacter tepidarius TaxID=60454 RepID=UPI00117FD12B|nr:tetratricopeptide repeat protein [Erythrobacter tepidarius]